MKTDRRGIGMIIVWMFVFIAGALILILFFVIANVQADNAKRQLAYDAYQELDAILATQSGSTESYATVPVPGDKIRFTCTPQEGIVFSQVQIGDEYALPKPTPYQLLAARDVETETLYMFSKQLRMPFLIGSILYVTSPYDTLTLQFSDPSIDEDHPLYQGFVNELPPTVREHVTNQPLSSRNKYQNIRYVLIGSAGFSPIGDDVSYIAVFPEDENKPYDAGEVVFYKQTSPSTISEISGAHFKYRGFAMMLAYIWQGDPVRAECLTRKLGLRVMLMADLQLERLRLLQTNRQHEILKLVDTGDLTPQQAQDAIDTDECLAKYLSEGALTSLYSMGKDAKNNMRFNDFGAIDTVVYRNEGMLRGVRCATIY